MAEKDLGVIAETPMQAIARRKNERRNAMLQGQYYGMGKNEYKAPSGIKITDKHTIGDLFDKNIEGSEAEKFGNFSQKHGTKAIGSLFNYLSNTRLGKKIGSSNLTKAGTSLANAASPHIKSLTSHAYTEGKNFLTKQALKKLGTILGSGALSYLGGKAFGGSRSSPTASLTSSVTPKFANGGRVCVSKKERNKFEGSSGSTKVEQFRNHFR